MMLKFSEEFLIQKNFNILKWRIQANFLHFTALNIQQTHYDVLGVPKGASQSEIKESYLKLCKLHHPDASNDPNLSKDEKVKKFQRINEAYQCLSKLESKMAYDNTSSTFHPGYTNPYADRTRSYPRRPDGYRPYEEYSYQNSFRNKSQFSFHRRYDNPDNNYDRFRQEYDDAMRKRYKQPSESDVKAFRILFLVSAGIIIYIVSVRLYVLSTFQKRKDMERYGFPPIQTPNRYSRFDNIPYQNKSDQDLHANQNEKRMDDQEMVNQMNEEENRRFKGYQFTKGEKFTGPTNQFGLNRPLDDFNSRMPSR